MFQRVEELCLKSLRMTDAYVTLGGVHKMDSDTGELGTGLPEPRESRNGEGGIRSRESSIDILICTNSSSSWICALSYM